MREQHECYPNELKPEERIQTIWSQQVVLSSSGTFFQDKKTKKLYQYDLSCIGGFNRGGRNCLDGSLCI